MATTSRTFPVVGTVNDKINHVAAFFVLAFFMDFSFPHRRFWTAKGMSLLGYGLLVEIIQSFLPYRFFSMLDLAADAVGIALYCACSPVIVRCSRLRR